MQYLEVLRNSEDPTHNVEALRHLGATALCIIATLPEEERTKEQKVDIVLRSSELIRALEEEAVEYKKTFKGNQHTKVVTGSTEPVSKRTNERIGEMTGTSKTTVKKVRLNVIRWAITRLSV